jgi:hypothetical protein
MRKIDLIHIKTRGDLAYRQLLNYSRLESENYRPDTVFSFGTGGWPGDWEGRTILGLGLLLLGQFLMFAFSALGWQGLIDPTYTLPPLDRAFTLLSIVILIWLWAFPEPSRVADGATVLLVLLIVVASVLSLLTWAPQASFITNPLAKPFGRRAARTSAPNPRNAIDAICQISSSESVSPCESPSSPD